MQHDEHIWTWRKMHQRYMRNFVAALAWRNGPLGWDR